MYIPRVRHWGKHFFLRTITAVVLALAMSTFAESNALDLAREGLAAKERRQFALAVRLLDQALLQGSFAKKQQGFLIYSRGVSYEALGLPDKAMADFDAAIALVPDFPNAYIYRGLLWDDKGEHDRAIEDFLHAGRLDPNDPTVFINLGGAYDKKGDSDRAIESYDQAIRLRPDFAVAYYNRAQAHIGKQDVTRAIADYEQAIRLQPGFADAYANRAILYLALGQSDQALADLGVAIRLSPREVTFWANRANAYLSIGKYDDALKDFDQALQIDPANPAIYLGRGRARLFGGDSAAGVEDLKTVVWMSPSNPYGVIWLHIARVHRGEADREELAANAEKVNRGIWPSALLDLYLGTSDAARVRSAAREGPSREEGKRTCEAEFYIAEFEVHRGQASEARRLLEAVAARCRPHDVVYSAAIAELGLVR